MRHTVTKTVSLPPATAQQLEQDAERYGLSESAIVKFALGHPHFRTWLGRMPAEPRRRGPKRQHRSPS